MAEHASEKNDTRKRGRRPCVGLALGSGSARGWAHIGVIQELEALGIRPDVVAGTSIGALVGGVYVAGQLDAFEKWVTRLTFRDVIGFLDISFSGGFVKGEKLFSFFSEQHLNPKIEELTQRFATVATDMQLGREVWIQDGPVLDAARASCALPGLFSPVKHDDRWMLDGGLVNPVPVSVCRALGADLVIAVNLNGQLIGRHLSHDDNLVDDMGESVSAEERSMWGKMVDYFSSEDDANATPGFFDVIGASVNIMQDRITRSRMAGEPAELTLIPMLEDFAIMDFHRAADAIEEGRRLVRANAERIAWLMGRV
ncbi:patatin-like phospholipase RssA [Alcanivorax sp. JB21]|uniref:patatin-like phospholipase RssA n=1 Tax=Alcanivorax limicola TaxID=2874102 RepID=UPI001CC1BBED|nr:patatin-like phospholipase RssA [Alcanivorax limicola]MBZ2189560.1 patatin-like phospholipase RssA [Alcanivorax limicola]